MKARSDPLKITVAQMRSSDSADENFQQIETLFKKNSKVFPSHLTVFPENCLFMKIQKGGGISGISLADGVFSKLRALCSLYGTSMLLALPAQEGEKIFNAIVFLSAEKGPEILYRKIHLFDVALDGHSAFKESRHFAAGAGPALWSFQGWRFGLSVCYDLRFAGLYNFYAGKEADILLVPSAFLMETGKKHWHALLKARAIESQCYTLAPAQSGRHQSAWDKKAERWTYGHSLAVSPDGKILLDMGESDPALRTVLLSQGEIKKARRQIPMARHRRL